MTRIMSIEVFETKLLNKIVIYFLSEINIPFYSKFKFRCKLFCECDNTCCWKLTGVYSYLQLFSCRYPLGDVVL